MINKSKLIGIAAVVALGFASQAFAQQRAYDPGLYAYYMVPAYEGSGSFTPGASGGGSFAYNENLRRNDW
jgi:hypothetical protein